MTVKLRSGATQHPVRRDPSLAAQGDAGGMAVRRVQSQPEASVIDWARRAIGSMPVVCYTAVAAGKRRRDAPEPDPLVASPVSCFLAAQPRSGAASR